jgi:hypothetical protein
MKKGENKLKEVDYDKLRIVGKLKNSERDLSQYVYINETKSKAINNLFKMIN